MKQEIQEVVAGGIMSIDRPVEKEGAIQHRSHHMVEMTDKGCRAIEMGVEENRKDVVVLEVTAKGSRIDAGGDHDEQETDKRWADEEPFHGVLILHRALMV
jgi:hypothetical protein